MKPRKTRFQRRCLRLGLCLMLGAACLQAVNCAMIGGYEWSAADKKAAAAMTLGRGADMLSTHDALSRGARETNPFLGSHPDDATLALWWAGSSVFCLGIAHVLPSVYAATTGKTLSGAEASSLRRAFLYGIGAVSAGVAVKNFFETR